MKVLEVARAQLGLSEKTGNNDGVPTEKFAGGRKEPWCAHFVAWCFREAGRPIPGDTVPSLTRANPLASVAHMERVMREHEYLYREPKPGDIVFFASRGRSDAGPGRHCGIVERVDPQEKTIYTIEGNLGNAVKRAMHYQASKRIVGYGRLPEEV